MSVSVLVIPLEGPIEAHELGGDSLGKLQELVGGCIEALPLPDFIEDAEHATAYIHDEGKWEYPPPDGVNWRATDFMVPGVGLFFGDYIAGPFVLAGFDPLAGEHDFLPPSVERRARLIESESGR